MRISQSLSTFLLAIPLTMPLTSSAQDMAPILTLEMASTIRDGCINYAETNNLKMAIAIYDAHGNLKLFTRMDETTLGSVKAAHWKGLSAATYQYSSADTAKWNVPTLPDIATSRGGLPIKTKDGKALGGIGVSGAVSAIDERCAQAGLLAAEMTMAIPKETTEEEKEEGL